MHRRLSILILALSALTFSLDAQKAPAPMPTPASAPASAGFDQARAARADEVIRQAIDQKQLPGAVLLVGRGDQVVYEKAYGNRAVTPSVEPMTLDTIFDMASVTKVVATTTSVMILVEEGRIRLSDRVATFIPEFGKYGKNEITVRHLLTHAGGLRPDIDMNDEFHGYDAAIERACEEVPVAAPGERFIYSDIDFFLLGDIVKRVGGKPLDQFVRERVFAPLGMRESTFNPPASLRPRIAPTEPCSPLGWPCAGPGQVMLRGVVHDPTARRMDGVAGHAGLFSTARDMSLFARMLLESGSMNGVRILSPLTVAKMTSRATPDGFPSVRGLGWDIDSAYSSNRGELFPIGSFGHTGFTGTSIWVDPVTRTYVIFLSNRVHPDGKGDVTPLRARVATVIASALRDPVPASALREQAMTGGDFGASGSAPRASADEGHVLNGVDVLQADGFKILQGKHVGLLTNHTGRTRAGASTIDVLAGAKGVNLVALFSPEHGIRGVLDAKVDSARDEKTGLPIHSLYGTTTRPTDAMLQGIDTMVIDLQDVGARFYTYTTTMAYVMEEAAKRKISVVLLDRVNPINGFQVEGPTLDPGELGFTAYFPMPIRHGMTLGELATLFNAEKKTGAELTVVPARGWHRSFWFDQSGLAWVNPSPNMRNLVEATTYTGVGSIEGSNLSVGRGTDTPFEHIGAPWIDGVRLADELNRRGLAGVRFYPVSFTPSSSKYANELCQGVFIVVTDRERLRPVRMGTEMASAIYRLYPSQYRIDSATTLLGARTVGRIKAGDDPSAIADGWSGIETRWRLLRAKYLLYR